MILDDELEVLLLLNYLPDSWGNLVISLSNLTPNGQLTMDICNFFNASDGNALVSESKDKQGRTWGCDFCPNFNRDRSRAKSQSRKDKQCYYYKRFEHLRNECRKTQTGVKKKITMVMEKKQERKETTTVVVDIDVIIVSNETCVNIACQNSSWVIDSSAL